MSRIDGFSRRKKQMLIGALLCALLWVFGSGSVLISQDELQDKSVANYNLTYAERGPFVRTSRTSAEVYFVDNIGLRFKNSGARLREILVKKEWEVNEGDALAVFDIERSQADLINLKLAYQRAVDADAQAKIDWRERLDKMQEAIGEESDVYARDKLRLQLERAELEYEQYRHSYDYEQAVRQRAIDKMEKDMNDDTLKAPFDAVVRGISMINPGDSVTAGDHIMTLYSKENFLLRVEDTNGQIRYNMDVRIEAGGRNNPQYYSGVVVAADNVLPSKLKTGYAYIRIHEMADIDPDEMRFVQIEYDLIRLEDVVTIKRKALTMERGSQYLTLLVDDAVKKRFMNVGMHNGEDQWIIQGLEGGQAVILN